jgi:predicted PurR-regulated permease PerM
VPTDSRLLRTLLNLGSLVLVVAFLYWAQAVLVPLALAVLLAFVLTPPAAWLERRGLGRTLSVVAVALLAFAVIGVVGWAVLRQTADLGRQANDHRGNIVRKLTSWQEAAESFGGLKQVFQGAGSGPPEEEQTASQLEGTQEKPLTVTFDPDDALLGWFPHLAWPVLEGAGAAVLVLVLVVFMLMQREDLRDRLIRLGGPRRLPLLTRMMDDAARRIGRYLSLMCLLNVAFGVAIGLGLAVLGVRYALLWGVLAAALRFVPYLGAWVAALFPLALSFAEAPGWVQPALVLALFAVLELGTRNFVEPYLYGQNAGLLPVSFLIAVAFWAWLWGPVGLVLATPLTICLAVLGKHVKGLRFFRLLLNDETTVSGGTQYYQRLLARDEDGATELVEQFLADHAPSAVFDDVLAPALRLARRDRDAGELHPDEAAFVYRVTCGVIDNVIPHPGPGPEGRPSPGLLLGWPVRDEGDELVLRMLRLLLAAEGCRMEVAPEEEFVGQLVERVRRQCPSVVVLASLPPGGVLELRPLAKRLRRECPDLAIVVARWGRHDEVERLKRQLRGAGIERVAGSSEETRRMVVDLLQGRDEGCARPEAAEPVRA